MFWIKQKPNPQKRFGFVLILNDLCKLLTLTGHKKPATDIFAFRLGWLCFGQTCILASKAFALPFFGAVFLDLP
jgi:hypothetical protein